MSWFVYISASRNGVAMWSHIYGLTRCQTSNQNEAGTLLSSWHHQHAWIRWFVYFRFFFFNLMNVLSLNEIETVPPDVFTYIEPLFSYNNWATDFFICQRNSKPRKKFSFRYSVTSADLLIQQSGSKTLLFL